MDQSKTSKIFEYAKGEAVQKILGGAATQASAGSPATKPKIASNGLKKQLQAKSTARRKKQAADTKTIKVLGRQGRNDLQPELKTVTRSVETLRISDTRTRITTPELLEKVITSIKQFGLVQPVLIDATNMIITGHALWEAAIKLGLKDIPCILIDHLDEIEMQALALALNKIGESGAYDLDRLRDRMFEIESAGIELTTTGFSLPEIDQVMVPPIDVVEEQTADDEEDVDAQEDGPTVSEPGDLFQLCKRRIEMSLPAS